MKMTVKASTEKYEPKFVVSKDEEQELRIVWAEVYAPNKPDADGEYMTAETIREMAYKFVKDLRLDQVDVQHDNETREGVQIVETFIARKGDPDFIEGSWVVGVHIPDDILWDQVKKGEINGFSVQAKVYAEAQEVELHMPPVISGTTSKSEDHVHKFYVGYDSEGKFIGGVTDEVNGHKHLISKGTLTERVLDHTHTFCAVDDIEIVK